MRYLFDYMPLVSRKPFLYACVIATGLSIGVAAITRLQNKVLTDRVQTLTKQLKQERDMIQLHPVGPNNEDATPNSFCSVNLPICWEAIQNAQKQAETCEEKLTGTTNELASKEKELKQCRRDSWISLTLFRRLKAAFEQKKQE